MSKICRLIEKEQINKEEYINNLRSLLEDFSNRLETADMAVLQMALSGINEEFARLREADSKLIAYQNLK